MLKIKTFVVNPFQENTYVIYDETLEAVVIDCGAFHEGEQKAISKFIDSNSLVLKKVVATHAHIDHNFGNAFIYEQYGVAPEVAESDAVLMECLPQQARAFCGIDIAYAMPEFRACLKDGDIVRFGNHELKVIATPGHTPGSVVLLCEQDNIAFTGDTLFKMSIGRTDLELGSFPDMMSSLKKLRDVLDGKTVIFPGHGDKTVFADELQMNPFFH